MHLYLFFPFFTQVSSKYIGQNTKKGVNEYTNKAVSATFP